MNEYEQEYQPKTEEQARAEAETYARESTDPVCVYFMYGEYTVSGPGFKGGRLVATYEPGITLPPSNHNRFQV